MPREGAAGSPGSLRKLWHPEAGGRRDALNASRIVAAGLELADAEGLASVTIRKVAARIDHAAMALYRHIDSREDLLLMMLDAGLGTPPARSARTSWKAGLRGWATGLFDRYVAHPWLLDIPLPGVPVTPNHALWVEQVLAITATAGLSVEQRLESALLIDGHVRNIANVTRSLHDPDARAHARHEHASRELAESTRHPLLRQALAGDALRGPQSPGISFGIDVILAGLTALERSE